MGKMLVSFHQAGQTSMGDAMPVARLSTAKTENVTTNAATSAVTTSQAATTAGLPAGNTNRKQDGGFATVTAVGVNILAVAGAAPTAAMPAAGALGSGFPVMAGQSITFAVAKGDKVAGIEFT